MWWILLVLIPILLLFVPFKFILSFNDYFSCKISCFGIPVFKHTFSSETKNKNFQFGNFDFKIKKIKKYIEILKDIFIIFEKHVRTKLIFSKFYFDISYGNGNAAETAIRCGVFYSVVYGFLGYLLERYNIKRYTVNVTPDFEESKTAIVFEIATCVTLMWIISLFVHERHALMSLINIIKKEDGVVNE